MDRCSCWERTAPRVVYADGTVDDLSLVRWIGLVLGYSPSIILSDGWND